MPRAARSSVVPPIVDSCSSREADGGREREERGEKKKKKEKDGRYVYVLYVCKCDLLSLRLIGSK
jgi:hypothetical protein